MTNAPTVTIPDSRFRSLGVRAVAAMVALGAAWAGAGCGESAEVEAASRLEEVNRALLTLTVGGGAPASDEFKSRTYAKVITELQPLAGAQDAPYQSAARGLLARAQAGQAEMKAAEATALGREALDMMSRASAALSRYVSQHALADALVAFDATPERASIEQKLREAETGVGEATAKKAEIDAMMADLRRQVAEHGETARALRDGEASLRSDALRAEAAERTAIIERAVAEQRRADAAEVEMAKAAALVERRRPELEAAQREIERIARQRENLTLTLRESQERERVVASQADANRKLAAEAEAEFAELAAAIDERLRGEVDEAFAEALRLLQAALGSARSAVSGAGTDGRTPAQLAVGRIQLAIAEAQRERAHLWETYSALLTRTRSLDAPMRRQSEFAQLQAGAEAQRAEAAGASREALAEAMASLEQAGARGEVAERVDRAVERLGELTGAPVDEAADDAPAVEEDAGAAGDSSDW